MYVTSNNSRISIVGLRAGTGTLNISVNNTNIVKRIKVTITGVS